MSSPVPGTIYAERLARVRAALAARGLDGFVVPISDARPTAAPSAVSPVASPVDTPTPREAAAPAAQPLASTLVDSAAAAQPRAVGRFAP